MKLTGVCSQEEILYGIQYILNKKLSIDNFTVEHSGRVVEISISLGREIGLSPDELEELRLAALLHDIGKIAVNPEILNKPGPLTSEEYIQIMEHVVVIRNIAKNNVNERVLEMISHHHDNYDGSGLNQTIVGKDIPLGARILTLADAFDAMTSDRPYRAAMAHEEAFMEIRRCSSTKFDPGIAIAFLKMHLCIPGGHSGRVQKVAARAGARI